ncbi:MAG: hypothetical protein N2506_03895, partial [Dehalococcoidales bacterium]|nr:hypothetical protein [Dehalococcoidales bacterium]
MARAKQTKYGHFIKPLTFRDFGIGSFRQGTEMDADLLGYDLNIQYGIFWAAGRIGSTPYHAEVHDYDQVMVFMGLDTYDEGYLGAEGEFSIGEERETHMITTSTAVVIPKVTPHMPATVNRMDDRFVLMTISLTRDLTATRTLDLSAKPAKPAEFMRAKYREYVQPLAFTRNGPWHYGPLNQDTHDGAITDIRGKGFEFHMSYESVNRAPYRFGPVPDKP